MKSHLERCGKYKAGEHERIRSDPDSSEPPYSDFFRDVRSSDNPTRGIMTADKLCEQMLRVITEGNLPFSQVENVELVALLKHAYPDLNPPNRRAVATRLKDNVVKEKEKLKAQFAKLDSKVSLALDAWTTRNNVAFLGMSDSENILTSV